MTTKEEKELNQLDKQITTIMIEVEKTIKSHHNIYPWSSELHNDVRTVSIWKAILTQYKPKIFHQSQLVFLTTSTYVTITPNLNRQLEIKRKLRSITKELKRISKTAK